PQNVRSEMSRSSKSFTTGGGARSGAGRLCTRTISRYGELSLVCQLDTTVRPETSRASAPWTPKVGMTARFSKLPGEVSTYTCGNGPYLPDSLVRSKPSRYATLNVVSSPLSRSTLMTSPWRVQVLVPLRRHTMPLGATAVEPCSPKAASTLADSPG